MPLVDLPLTTRDVARVTLRFAMAGGAGIGQTHLDLTPNTSLTDLTAELLEAVASIIIADAMTEILNCITADCEFTEIRVESLKNPALLAFSSFIGVDGNVVAETMPSFTQVTLIKRTIVGGRAGRGRMQMPCVAETFIAENNVSGTGSTAYNAFCAEFMGGFLTSGPDYNWFPCLAKRDVFDPGTGKYIIRSSDLTTLAFRPLVGTQRKRMTGRGT